MQFLSLVLALALNPAVGAVQTTPATPPIAQPEVPKEKLVCRREDGVGSRLNQRICKTRAQWVEFEKAQANRGLRANRDDEGY